MIRLEDQALPAAAARRLADWQLKLDGLAGYPARVTLAATRFKSRNTGRNRTFEAVRKTLAAMCSGAQRCGYCEDSVADEVEHVAPKSLFADRAFDWGNYLYACGPCNGPKNDQFAVFDASGQSVEIARASGAPITVPQAGAPLLIDPRRENFLDFLELDLAGTFRLGPAIGLRPSVD